MKTRGKKKISGNNFYFTAGGEAGGAFESFTSSVPSGGTQNLYLPSSLFLSLGFESCSLICYATASNSVD